jgi:hypothetical protein
VDLKMQCLICEKNIKLIYSNYPNNPDNGGEITVSFGYGSKHDQLPFIERSLDAPLRIDNLLSCDLIKAWICDDCFEKKQHLFNGFQIKKQVTEIKVI